MEEHHHEEYFKKDFLLSQLEKTSSFQTVSSALSILSDTARLKIFWLLCHTKECVINIAHAMNMTNPAVSHHLKVLRDADLIDSERDGKEVFYFSNQSERSRALHSIIEQLMEIDCPDFDSSHEKINTRSDYLEDQVSHIRQIHDYLIENLEKRITIKSLAKQFGINPTTLKTVFKDVYGSSLASHMKTHRMEKAALLLAQTDLPVSEIASRVGYESQSRFAQAFYECYKAKPLQYRHRSRGIVK